MSTSISIRGNFAYIKANCANIIIIIIASIYKIFYIKAFEWIYAYVVFPGKIIKDNILRIHIIFFLNIAYYNFNLIY